MAKSQTTDWPAIYRILSDSTRREIIRYLLESRNQTTLADLADAIAGDDADDDDRRDEIRVRLFHVTLPMMAEASLLEWDSETGDIELTNTTYQVPLGVLSPPDVMATTQDHGQRADD